MKCMIIPVITGANGIVTKGVKKNLQAIPGKQLIDSLQQTTSKNKTVQYIRKHSKYNHELVILAEMHRMCHIKTKTTIEALLQDEADAINHATNQHCNLPEIYMQGYVRQQQPNM
jgi:hypothetical protein